MEARSTSSDLISATSSDHYRARHLLAILLSLRRPSSPVELASKCVLFSASPELVIYLCSFPNSLISLNKNLLVVPSPVAVRSLFRSFADSCFAKGIRMRNPELDDTVLASIWLRKRKQAWPECGVELPRKRRLLLNCEEVREENREVLEVQFAYPKVLVTENLDESIDREQFDVSEPVNNLPFDAYSSGKCNGSQELLIGGDAGTCIQRNLANETMVSELNLEVRIGPFDYQISYKNRSTCISKFISDDVVERSMKMIEGSDFDGIADVETSVKIDEKGTVEEQEIESPVDSCSFMEEQEILSQTYNVDYKTEKQNDKGVHVMSSFEKEQTNMRVETLDIPEANKAFVALKRSPKLHAKMKAFHVGALSSQGLKLHCKSLELDKNIATGKEKNKSKGNHNAIELKQKRQSKERKRSSSSIPPKDQTEEKMFPNFRSYDVEEEEGSGGYGTVYRARRKIEGTTVAIKCPHAKSHKHHILNEQRMLERFGGKNFIIKYEGCVMNGDSDCFVLEHVEHDRPEILKKEMDIIQLQWYGYCMFKALASLHKQGVVHRDVKPGNFLFSLKASKGYLIDFNLALDLHQKHGERNDGKLNASSDTRTSHVKLSNEKYIPAKSSETAYMMRLEGSKTKVEKYIPAKSSETAYMMRLEGSKTKVDVKIPRRKVLTPAKVNAFDKSQGAEGSGITSAERKKEPLPCQGRKELISLVQEARQSQSQSQNIETMSVLSPLRKRVVAPQNDDRSRVYLTPMPLLQTGNFIGGSIPMNKGNGKSKKEGPCVGTKGFRAPEVLFRSVYQGPKVDIWSAGVTLLYLMIGRTPFFGDPEQNIKDIAKLRGSEELWEVAKLHNRESSFPEDLYNAKSLPCTKLLDWCKTSTKRPDFLDKLPGSLFDLVDKCLTVNPRLRITAEEALRHEFFAPCHEALRKQRLHRQAQSESQSQCLDPENTSSSQGRRTFKPLKPSQVKS